MIDEAFSFAFSYDTKPHETKPYAADYTGRGSPPEFFFFFFFAFCFIFLRIFISFIVTSQKSACWWSSTRLPDCTDMFAAWGNCHYWWLAQIR